MSRDVKFTQPAFEEFWYWASQDKKTLKKIYRLISDTQRNGYGGIGKPEPLAGDLAGYWSKRIDDANRFIFRIADNVVEIYQCYGHYEK